MKLPSLDKAMDAVAITGALSLVGQFLIESHYANSPLVPDPATGRTIPVPIRLHGTVYLTASENLLRAALIGVTGACAVLIVVLWVLDRLRQTRR